MLTTLRKRRLVSVCAALLLAVGTAGLVNAQTTPPQTPAAQTPAAQIPAAQTPAAQGTPEESHHHGWFIATAAQAIGITPQQLRQELPGKSLAEVAQAHGKNPADVAAALKTESDAHIDQLMSHVWSTTHEGDEEGTSAAAGS